jgi:hypothetical protein
MTTNTYAATAATPAMRDAIVSSPDGPVLVDYVRAGGPEGIKFDVWYSNSYVPALSAGYGLRRLRRYAVPSRAAYLVVGELDAGSGRKGEPLGKGTVATMAEHHERFVGEHLGTHRRRDVNDDAVEAAVVYPAMLRVPHDRMQDVGRWYEEEHLPILMSCPQWVMTRRYRVTAASGLDFTHVALHYLTDVRALQSPERDTARDTPWRNQLIAEGWFVPEYRVCYRVQDLSYQKGS